MSHDDSCEALPGAWPARACFCAVRADVHRFQEENWQRVSVATDPEKDEVLRYLNDHDPDILREAMDETGVAQ
jgi:hypothetical protein